MKFVATRFFPALALAMFAGQSVAFADGEVQRIDQRFSSAVIEETPDFRREVVPLLGRMGCNGRACHGSFQGRGGFRLSLFGYDFKSDHEMLTGGESPRVNRDSTSESLILQKPTETIPHEGGRRLEKGTWQYEVLKRWIEGGAASNESGAVEFVKLEVTPAEIQASKPGEKFVLKAIAHWSDGSRHDVTPLCRFKTNNDQVAVVDDEGVVTSADPGDSHVIVTYDNGVVPVSVIQPVSRQAGENYPALAAPTQIDELVAQKHRKLGLIPSDVCTDAEFLRRVSLDMTGTLPLAGEVEKFLSDNSPTKRAAKIDELLERPTYAIWWANRFSDWTGNNAAKMNYNNTGVDAATRANEWYEWLRIRIDKNLPYDQIAAGLILSSSRLEGESYEKYCERMSGYYHKKPTGNLAELETMPHYWIRRDFVKPEDRAMGFAYTFLGIRIQCAQCHKHPFDQWTKDDFDRFTGFFDRARYGIAPKAKADYSKMLEEAKIDVTVLKGGNLGKEIRARLAKDEVMPFNELFLLPAKRAPKKAIQEQATVTGRTAKILGGETVTVEYLDDPRKELMEWLRDEQNPYFARAIVNRVWSGYFNCGIVDPVDDLSLANPPSNGPLLDHLATEFRKNGYDLKWLHRTIANSLTYQRSWKPNETNKHDERNFSRAVPRRLPAEVAYDAVQLATMGDAEAAKWTKAIAGRATANANMGVKGGKGRNDYALSIFGRSTRESNCECDRSSQVSLLQTVYLKNDQDVIGMVEGRGRWVDQFMRYSKPNPADPKSAITDLENAPVAPPAQPSIKQLRRRLATARKKGRMHAVEAIESELDRRQQMDPDAKDERAVGTPSKETDLDALVRQAYLRTLGRLPTEAEMERVDRYFDEYEEIRAAKDVLWALINTREFATNH